MSANHEDHYPRERNGKSAKRRKESRGRSSEETSTVCGRGLTFPTKEYTVGSATKSETDAIFAALEIDLNSLSNTNTYTNEKSQITTLSVFHAIDDMTLILRGTRDVLPYRSFRAAYAMKCFDPLSQAADFAPTGVLVSGAI